MAKTEKEESANDKSYTTPETKIPTIGAGIGTRFRIATASDYHPIYDQQQVAQLTVSSVNTILEDLPETEDEDDDAPRDPIQLKNFDFRLLTLRKR